MNPFQALGLCAGASEDNVKRAYRRLALEVHPDKAGPDGEEKMKKINIAYEEISSKKLWRVAHKPSVQNFGHARPAFSQPRAPANVRAAFKAYGKSQDGQANNGRRNAFDASAYYSSTHAPDEHPRPSHLYGHQGGYSEEFEKRKYKTRGASSDATRHNTADSHGTSRNHGSRHSTSGNGSTNNKNARPEDNGFLYRSEPPEPRPQLDGYITPEYYSATMSARFRRPMPESLCPPPPPPTPVYLDPSRNAQEFKETHFLARNIPSSSKTSKSTYVKSYLSCTTRQAPARISSSQLRP